MKWIFMLLFSFAGAVQAGPEDWLASGLPTPEVISSLREELQLSPEQETAMSRLAAANLDNAVHLNHEVREAEKDFVKLLRQADTTPEAAAQSLDRLLQAEAAVKHLRLKSLLALRDNLSAEQQEKALALMPGHQVKRSGGEVTVREKARKLKAAVQAVGIPPTLAMVERGKAVEALVRDKDFAAADRSLDLLIAESGMDVKTETARPDFGSYPPGETTVEALQQRYAAVETAAQKIISLPLVRSLVLGKKALETAKKEDDAEKVGRILSWAESVLGLTP